VKLVSALRNRGLVKEVMTITEHGGNKKKHDECFDKCMCVYKLPVDNFHRRVDIILCEARVYPFVKLGWTGSQHFERSLRLFAEKKRNVHVSSSEMREIHTGALIKVKTEREIFEYLGLNYIDPTKRNC